MISLAARPASQRAHSGKLEKRVKDKAKIVDGTDGVVYIEKTKA